MTGFSSITWDSSLLLVASSSSCTSALLATSSPVDDFDSIKATTAANSAIRRMHLLAFRGLNRIISDGNVELVLAECSTSLEYEFQLVCGSVAWLLFYSRFGKIAFSPKVILK